MSFRRPFWLVIVSLPVAFLLLISAGREDRNSLYFFLHVFSDAAELIKSHYVRDIEPRRLIYGAIQGMLRELDNHSEFLDPESLTRVHVETEGEYVGIGAKVSFSSGAMLVLDVMEDSSAFRAGLRPKDRITAIGGKDLSDLGPSEAMAELNSAKGSALDLTVTSHQSGLSETKKLTRAKVSIAHVRSARMIGKTTGYIDIARFGREARHETVKALDAFRAQGADRFILDVRGNPGGTLDAVLEVSELFLKKGDAVVVIVRSKDSESHIIRAKENGAYTPFPLAVLVDGRSASASEVFASALRYHGRAKLFGTKTFGKGSVQALLNLRDGSAIRITTSEYVTPAGHVIEGVGITPDFLVETSEEQLRQAQSYLERLAV